MTDWPAMRARTYVWRAKRAQSLAAEAALPEATDHTIWMAESAAKNLELAAQHLKEMGEEIPPTDEEAPMATTTDTKILTSDHLKAINAAVATAMSPAPAAIAPAAPVISADELAAREVDATVARITGDDTVITAGIERRAQERADATGKPSAADIAKADEGAAAVAARICAA